MPSLFSPSPMTDIHSSGAETYRMHQKDFPQLDYQLWCETLLIPDSVYFHIRGRAFGRPLALDLIADPARALPVDPQGLLDDCYARCLAAGPGPMSDQELAHAAVATALQRRHRWAPNTRGATFATIAKALQLRDPALCFVGLSLFHQKNGDWRSEARSLSYRDTASRH